MKLNQVMTKVIVLMTALAMPFATIAAPAAAPAKMVTMEGVIVSRDGNNLQVRGDTEATATTVAVSDATKVESTSSFLIFTSSKPMTAAALIPGLRIKVAGEASGSQVVAKGIRFREDDLKTASAIQAALAVPQQQISSNQQGIVSNKQQNEVQEQQIVANKQKNEAQEQQIVAVDKRFGDLADYDKKGEAIINFDVNSAKLSDKAKEDVCAAAATAKTFKGYLIQVAGYADSTGDAARNQNLSDRRADAVAAYLQQSCDVMISRVLAPAAMGTSKPIAANETAQGRAENRRVTIKILVNRGITDKPVTQ